MSRDKQLIQDVIATLVANVNDRESFFIIDTLMEEICMSISHEDYIKFLKKVGKYVDDAREGYGIK